MSSQASSAGETDRPLLSRELLAETALDMTREAGLGSLSMRKLGAELGVEAMSLYHYVDSKADLLLAMADRLYAAIELPALDSSVPWEQLASEALRSYHAVLESHRSALELINDQPAESASALAVLSWVYELFRSLGLSVSDSAAALHFAVAFVHGQMLFQHSNQQIGVNGRAPSEDAGPAVQEFIGAMRGTPSQDYLLGGLEMVMSGLRQRFDLP